MSEREFQPLGCAVVTVSDTRSPATDRSGDLVAGRLEEAGHRLKDRRIVRDEREELEAAFRELAGRSGVEVVISTGGTGLTGRDVTPEAASAVYTKEIPGFGELFRWLSYEEIGPSTIQSRAQAGLADTTLLFNLPGSSGACRLAMDAIILPQLDLRTRPCNFAEMMPRFAER
ncbi:MAG: molybdenum cofactor synthesis domain-containing protein [Thiohalorhabdus sp.]|uniref:molybdenum cofactor synthesis domain-containing protein n=1 Tax=Thiohalorhabdus sp. TaxID=3094134 RepID=UPI00397EB0E3